MNRDRWKGMVRTSSPDVFLAKLAEEVGEVGKAYIEGTVKETCHELDHVIFIAKLMKDNVRALA